MSLPRSRGPGVGVLERAMAILDVVESGSRTFTAIVEATGFTRTTTHRMLKALEGHGLLEPIDGGGYRLGPRLLRLAASLARELPLRDLARPAMVGLARATGESAQLYVRSQDERICIDAVESESELRTIVRVGASLPLTAGSAGKVFLAWTSELDRERLLEDVRPFTKSTPDAPRLRNEIGSIRKRGWASSAGEREPGVASVSAPICDQRGDLVGVVSVSGPETRLGRSHARRYAPEVVVAAREIERSLGLSPG